MSFNFDIHDEESDQTIANVFEKDLEIEDLEQRSFVVEGKADIFPYVYEQKKVSDVGFPFLFGEQQGEFNHIFQDPFASLLETSEREILGICLRLVSGYNSSEKMSFGVGVKLLFELPP